MCIAKHETKEDGWAEGGIHVLGRRGQDGAAEKHSEDEGDGNLVKVALQRCEEASHQGRFSRMKRSHNEKFHDIPPVSAQRDGRAV